MEQVDGTVAPHITQTSQPNTRESTALIILFWISMIDRTKMLRFASSKGKGGTLTTHTRRVRVAPPTVQLARRSPEGTCVVWQFH